VPTRTVSARPFTVFLKRTCLCVFHAIRRPRNFCCRFGPAAYRGDRRKLRKRYHVELTLHPPKVPYRETIRAKAEPKVKHKKQTGGHGQFGVCACASSLCRAAAGSSFVDDVFGGAIPRNFIPSVEKGIRASSERGFLAGFPVVDFRAVLMTASTMTWILRTWLSRSPAR